MSEIMKLLIVVAAVCLLRTSYAGAPPEGIFASADGAIGQSTTAYESFLVATSNGNNIAININSNN